jgi:8-oxo-dGTP pyrophosphatase MutT (NUDIX family)
VNGLEKPKKTETATPRTKRPKWAREAGQDLSLAPGLLVELRGVMHDAGPLGSRGADLLESGALAFRRTKRRGLEILLISKRRAHKWGIPKGRLVPHLSFAENAAKEAFEEGGVIGRISPDAVGVFRAQKRSDHRLAPLVIEVWVYLLEVTTICAKWPEKGKRQTRWVSCEIARRQLREPALMHICNRLGKLAVASQKPSRLRGKSEISMFQD